MADLAQTYKFQNLKVSELLQLEMERKTALGLALSQALTQKQSEYAIPPELKVQLLKKIIYSGVEQDKFTLQNFAEAQDPSAELQYFEQQCCSLASVVYLNSEGQNGPIVEMNSENFAQFGLEASFQKEFKVKVMNYELDLATWQQRIYGDAFDYCVVMGPPLSGKSMLTKLINKHLRYKIIDWGVVREQLKKTLGTEEEPFEGEIAVDKLEQAVFQQMQSDRAKGQKYKYVFD